jgi:hypothetical protein
MDHTNHLQASLLGSSTREYHNSKSNSDHFCHFVSVIEVVYFNPPDTGGEKNGSTFLSGAPQFSKDHCFMEGMPGFASLSFWQQQHAAEEEYGELME